MTKKEQIEEMVNVMIASNNPFVDVPIEIMPKVAEALYNAGYQKGETISYQAMIDRSYIDRINQLEYRLEEARKETAKEILILLGKGFDETKMTEFKNLPWYRSFCRELKQRYGVEVEE